MTKDDAHEIYARINRGVEVSGLASATMTATELAALQVALRTEREAREALERRVAAPSAPW